MIVRPSRGAPPLPLTAATTMTSESTQGQSFLLERHGDLRVGLDFRRVYAAVLEEWLCLPAKAALGAEFEKLPLFRA